MNARDGSAGAPLVPQGVMHLVALVAIGALALALLVFPSVDARALPHDALEAAHEIEELPFRHDEVRLSDATVGPDEPAPSCFVPRHTAWYVLRPETDVPLSTWVVPDAGGDAPVDVALSAWGSIGDGPPVEVGCVDERGAGAPEQLVLPAFAGLTYHFAVSSPQLLDEDAGTLTFLVDEQAPAHDLFAFARWVNETPYEDAGVDASGARREPGESAPSCAALEATTWYGISSPQDAILSARVEPSAASGDPSDLAMALHTGGSVGSLLERACVDAAGPGEPEQLEFPVGAGEVYWMQVGAVLGETGPGEYTLSIAGMQTIELAPMPDTRFGAGPQTITAEASSGLPVALAVEGPCEVSDGQLSVNGAGLCTITATQAGDEAWAPAPAVTSTLRIGRGDQQITVEPVGRTRVGEPVAIDASVESGLPVEVQPSGPCVVADGSIVPSGAGQCMITVTQPGDTDWAPAEPVTTTVFIEPGRQAIDLGPLPELAVGEAVGLEASSDSALPVVFEAAGSCRVSGATLVGTGAGPCTVTASQPGDADWAPAEPVTRTLRIARGEQAIDVGPTPDTVFGSGPAEIAAEAGSGLPVALTVEGPCAIEARSLVATGAGQCTLTLSQPGDADWAPAEPIVRRITIDPASQAIELGPTPDTVFGAEPAELSAASDSGLPVELRASGPCAVEEGTLVATGAGACVLTASQAGGTDWAAAAPVVRRITIAPASQAIELAPLPELAVGEAAELSASSDSDLPVELTGSGPCLLVDERLQALGAGPCTVTASQPGDADWAPAEPVTRTLRIARGEQAIDVGAIEQQSLADGSVEFSASSSAGLPVESETAGPCHVDGDRIVLDGTGECTLTVSHPGDVDWAPAVVTEAFRIVTPGEAWREAEDKLVERTRSFGCSRVGSEDDPRPLANGALAGVRCAGTIDGVSVLWLFTYPDTDSLRAFQESRVDDGRGGLRMDPKACVSGRPGVREWDYGIVTCWVPQGASRSVLHWTDERTDTYAIIRPRVSSEGRLDELWSSVVDRVFEG